MTDDLHRSGDVPAQVEPGGAPDEGDEGAFGPEARAWIVVESPPVDVRAAVFRAEWWRAFCEWLPMGSGPGWEPAMAIADAVNDFLVGAGDEASARTLAGWLVDEPLAAIGRATFEELLAAEGDDPSRLDGVVHACTAVYWAAIDALAPAYDGFLAAAAGERARIDATAS